MSPQETINAIRASQIACNLTDEQVSLIAKSIRWAEYQSGQIIFRQSDPGESLQLIVEGRVKITVAQTAGGERFVDHLSSGEHFGEISVLTGQERATTATAVMDTRLLVLDRADFLKLMKQVPGLAANLSQALGFRLRRETTGQKVRNVSRVIGIVNDSANIALGIKTIHRLTEALSREGDTIRIISDDASKLGRLSGFYVSEIPRNMSLAAKSDWVQQRLSEQNSHEGHTLVCLFNSGEDELRRLLIQCGQVLWLSGLSHSNKNRSQLESLLRSESRLAARTHWGWLLREGIKPEDIPSSPKWLELPDFKIVLSNSNRETRLERMSISRLVRFIRKTRLGLALGGGAARGMAHLGVIKAFEEQGIYFDVLAGTSAGALMAVPYAYGLTPDECTEAFREDLRPSWLFRQIPKGNDWYMLYQFRFGKWDGLLRNRVGDVKLEQLLTPVSTVAADLITGQQVVRDDGDATHAILESINIPNISKPIIRQGMALVDGGIINNIPSDILAERGADLAVGVNIATQIAHRFGKNTPDTPMANMKAPGQLQTILRANEVQDYQITALRTQAVDQMITVDTSMFDFADFSSAREMSDAGYAAAMREMDNFNRMLQRQKLSESVVRERFVCKTCTN